MLPNLTHALLAFIMLTILNLPAAYAAQFSATSAVKGSLIAIGGALRMDNQAVWRKIVAEAGGPGARIAVIPAAAGNPQQAGERALAALQQAGADAYLLPLAPKLDPDTSKVAEDPAWLARLQTTRGVFFTGGDQARITASLRRADGSATAMLQQIWQIYRDGGVIAGSSAGAAMMSETMFYDAKPVLPTLKFGVSDGKEIAAGLGFAGPGLFIDQHLLIRGRFARMLPVMWQKKIPLGLGIDENSAMIIRQQRYVEVLGYTGAILMDLRQASSDRQQAHFNLTNARISYLAAGDQYDLQEHKLTPASDKIALDPGKPYHQSPIFYGDILANSVVKDLLFQLIDSAQQQARGICFGNPTSAASDLPELGFAFDFSKTAESSGWFSNAAGADAYTVSQIRLDVKAIKLNLPWFVEASLKPGQN